MQINGVGNETGHNHNMHQVTNCSHDHDVSKERDEALRSAAQNTVTAQSNPSLAIQQEGGISLSRWWKRLLAGGQRLFVSIWGEAPDKKRSDGKDDGLRDTEQVLTSIGDDAEGQSDLGTPLHTAGAEAAAGSGLKAQDLYNNPYFSAVEDTGKEKQTIGVKLRVRFQSLTGHLSGRFSNRNSFQTGQQKPKEDLRKHSRYRQDDLEIDCILTDDSYLMDSYDRKGEYRTLSAKK